MRGRRKWLAGLLFGTLFLSGCSRDTKTQVVAPKNQKENSLLSKGDEESLADQVQAPVRYQCDREIDGFRLLANARVIVPDVEGIKLKKIRSRNFTKSEMEKLQEGLLQGGNFYHFTQDTREILEMAEEDDGELYGAGTKAMVENETSVVEEKENIQMERERAFEIASRIPDTVQEAERKVPENYEEARALLQDFLDGKKTFAYNKGDDFNALCDLFAKSTGLKMDWMEQRKLGELAGICWEIADSFRYSGGGSYWKKQNLWEDLGEPKRVGFALTPNGGYYVVRANQSNMEVVIGLLRLGLDIIPESEFMNYNAEFADKINIYEDNLADLDLQQQSNELMKSLGFSDIELADIRDERIRYRDDYVKETEIMETSARSFIYTPVVDGVPITLVNNGSTEDFDMDQDGLVNWPSEEIWTTYGREGLLSFVWMGPAEVEEWQDEYAFLLPFSEIQKIFEEMLTSNYAVADMADNGELTISEVRLGYAKVVSKELLQEDSNWTSDGEGGYYTGVLVPVWDFIGQANGMAAQMYGVQDGDRVSYMTINAMDGSIIQR